MLNKIFKTKWLIIALMTLTISNVSNASIYTMAMHAALNHVEHTNNTNQSYNRVTASPRAIANTQESTGSCEANLYRGQTPTFLNTAYVDQTKLICFQSYALLTSGKTKTGIWSAELLTPQRIAQTETMRRANTFHVESQLPYAWQAQLADYVRSGYDRGHMSPSGDQPTEESQNDSFSLANMAPQAPKFNRGAWAHLEESVRNLAKTEQLYVVTGLLFKGNQIGFLNNRVAIPTIFYKVVYNPTNHSGSVFWGNNNDDAQVVSEPLNQFENENGIDFHMPTTSSLSLPSSGSHSNYTE